MPLRTSVDDFVRDVLREAPWDRARALMTTLTGIDRYQASAGIEQAADILAEEFTALGLPEPRLRPSVADGQAQWWSFRAPVAWTVERATLRIDSSAGTVEIDHGKDPFALATYSAPLQTTARPLRLVDEASMARATLDLRDAVAVVDTELWARSTTLPALERAGATAVLAPSFTQVGGRARLELAPDSSLTIFALTEQEAMASARLARAGARADVHVEIGRTASMPVLELVLPGNGEDDREIWVTSHLCHGRPGANDNLSGVAATVMTAAVLNRRLNDAALGRPVRFIWGPEYLATASALTSAPAPPAALVNLDMVGEDQAICRAPFVREQVSPTTPSELEWHSDYAVARAFAMTAQSIGTWRADPFLGFSDHALCADLSLGVPAVAFCHPDDPFNHSSDDTLDKVSRTEMLRSVAASATTISLQADTVGDVTELSAGRSGWVRRTLRAADYVAERALQSGHSAWAASYRSWTMARVSESPPEEAEEAVVSSKTLQRLWSGPVNLRALMNDLPPDLAARNRQRIMDDKRWMSLLFNTAIRVDGRSSPSDLLDDVSMNAARPIDHTDRELITEVLLESGWVAMAAHSADTLASKATIMHCDERE